MIDIKREPFEHKGRWYKRVKAATTGRCEGCAFQEGLVSGDCASIAAATCGEHYMYIEVDPLYEDLLKVKEMSDD